MPGAQGAPFEAHARTAIVSPERNEGGLKAGRGDGSSKQRGRQKTE